MTIREGDTATSTRSAEKPRRMETIGVGTLWIGRHASDQDILVLDPSETDAAAEVLSLYSLTEHRTRRFPRNLVLEKIHPLEDELALSRAKKDYARRSTLREAHVEALEAERNQRFEQVRDGVIVQHQTFVETLGLTYKGVVRNGSDPRPARVTKCHTCGIVLDDFVGVSCAICSGLVCSCGGCTCGKPGRVRKKAAAPVEQEKDV